MKLKAHIFICTNERPDGHPRGCCMKKQSESLVQLFKQEIARSGLNAEVRAQKAGCLDVCEYGPALVVYPDGIWYGKVQSEDVSEIVQDHLLKDKPVERLRIPGR